MTFAAVSWNIRAAMEDTSNDNPAWAGAPGKSRRLGIVVACVVGFVALLFVAPTGKHKVQSVDLNVIYKNQVSRGEVDFHGNKIAIHYKLSAQQRDIPYDLATESRNAGLSNQGQESPDIGDESFFGSIGSVNTRGETLLEFYFRRYNCIVSLSKTVVLQNWKPPELDRIEMESVARRLDDAIRNHQPGARVSSISIAANALENVKIEELPGMVAFYFMMGSVPLGIGAIPALILWILARFVKNSLGRLAFRSGVLAIYLAPGGGAGHGGVYLGPGFFMIFGEPGMMIPSVCITFVVFFGIALSCRYVWKGRLT
jgi:hypothetical protein